MSSENTEYEPRRYLVIRMTPQEWHAMLRFARSRLRRPQDEGRRVILSYLKAKGYLKSEGQCANVSEADEAAARRNKE